MYRITGSDAFGLMEAYNAVYAPQELTEEQVWEEVENWVNSLVEEGYDLSEYTWEDIYDVYINEVLDTPLGFEARAERRRNQAQTYQSRFARPMNAGTPVPQGTRRGAAPSRVTRPQIGSLPSNYRGAELQQSARARASQVGTTRQGTAGGPTVGGNTPIGTTKPTATTPTPAPTRPATAPARPAVTSTPKPTTTTTTTAPATAPAAPARTFNPLMQRTFAYQTGYAPSQVKQDPKKMAQMGSLRSISSSFDPFDIVQGYLIDEGYAETEAAAAVIMANMSEEWKESILESGYFPTKESQREDEKKYKMGGSSVKHRNIATQSPKPSR